MKKKYIYIIYIYIYIYIYGEMGDFSEPDKMIKISGKGDKSNTYNGLSGNILFFDVVLLLIKDKILPLNPL